MIAPERPLPPIFTIHQSMHGTIKAIVCDKGFGFIKRAGGEPDLFFHMRDLTGGLEFNERLRELRVQFDLVDTPKGPRASGVKPAE